MRKPNLAVLGATGVVGREILKITEEYPGIVDDLRDFLKINYHLKAIHIYAYSKSLIEAVVNLVKNDESKNIEALVLTPTRELSIQVAKEIEKLSILRK